MATATAQIRIRPEALAVGLELARAFQIIAREYLAELKAAQRHIAALEAELLDLGIDPAVLHQHGQAEPSAARQSLAPETEAEVHHIGSDAAEVGACSHLWVDAADGGLVCGRCGSLPDPTRARA
ncbi:MAG TPA: hypothetical protein VFH70_07785 [Acidimicrobiales bacterium]|nr:hypothetical protein [Acidimicrobiales bacterium]